MAGSARYSFLVFLALVSTCEAALVCTGDNTNGGLIGGDCNSACGPGNEANDWCYTSAAREAGTPMWCWCHEDATTTTMAATTTTMAATTTTTMAATTTAMAATTTTMAATTTAMAATTTAMAGPTTTTTVGPTTTAGAAPTTTTTMAPATTKFSGSLALGAPASVTKTQVEMAAKQTFSEHYNISASAITVNATQSRRLAAPSRFLASVAWSVSFEFHVLNEKVAAVDAKGVQSQAAPGVVALTTIFKTKLLATGVLPADVDMITVSAATYMNHAPTQPPQAGTTVMMTTTGKGKMGSTGAAFSATLNGALLTIALMKSCF